MTSQRLIVTYDEWELCYGSIKSYNLTLMFCQIH